MIAATESFDRRLAPEEFYWAVLRPDSAATFDPRGGDVRALAYQFEESLPVPIEDVQAVYVRLGDGRVLACGMERQRLETASGGVLSLGPTSVPSHLGVDADASAMNLLIGVFQPAEVAAARRRLASVASACVLACALLVGVGLQRRASASERAAAECVRLADAMVEGLLPAAGPDSQPAAVRFTSELRALRRSNASAQLPRTPDAVRGLQGMLRVIGPEPERDARVESMDAGEDMLSMTVMLGSHDQAQRWIGRAGIDGWKLEQPRVSTQKGAVRVAMRWRKSEGVGEARP